MDPLEFSKQAYSLARSILEYTAADNRRVKAFIKVVNQDSTDKEVVKSVRADLKTVAAFFNDIQINIDTTEEQSND